MIGQYDLGIDEGHCELVYLNQGVEVHFYMINQDLTCLFGVFMPQLWYEYSHNDIRLALHEARCDLIQNKIPEIQNERLHLGKQPFKQFGLLKLTTSHAVDDVGL